MPGFPSGQGGRTYGDTSIREDLSDIIFQITPEDTPFASSIGNAKATSTLHQWQKRSIRTRNVNARPEGFTYDFTAYTAQNPTRVTNLTQIFGNEVRVSETEDAVIHAGIARYFGDQMDAEMVNHETSIEHSLLRQTSASGTTNAAPQFIGMVQALFNNFNGSYTAPGATLTETMMNKFTAVGWRNGAAFRDVLVNADLKQSVSNFSQVNTRFIEADEQRLVRPVSVYLGDFEPLTIHRCRDMFVGAVAATNIADANTTIGLNGTGNGHSMLLYDRTACAKAWLRPTVSTRTAYIADSMDGVIKSELTLEWGNENMHLFVSNLIPNV